MNPKVLTDLREHLHRQRRATFQAVAGAEADFEAIADEREAEIEERAQERRDAELYAVLDVRGKHEIDEIDRALRRMADGRYGECASCGGSIALARLHAVPETSLCIRCASRAGINGAGSQ